jgi:hypothetical protein
VFSPNRSRIQVFCVIHVYGCCRFEKFTESQFIESNCLRTSRQLTFISIGLRYRLSDCVREEGDQSPINRGPIFWLTERKHSKVISINFVKTNSAAYTHHAMLSQRFNKTQAGYILSNAPSNRFVDRYIRHSENVFILVYKNYVSLRADCMPKRPQLIYAKIKRSRKVDLDYLV